MKKVLKYLLIIVFVVALIGCKKTEDIEGSSNKKVEIYDIINDYISTYHVKDNENERIEGEQRTQMLLKIPTEMKKVIGEIERANIKTPSVEGTYDIYYKLQVTGEKDFKTLTDYYKTLDGTVTGEVETDFSKIFYMSFDWGKIAKCEYNKNINIIEVDISIY